MPELPEVEVTCQGIRPYLLNHAITQVVVRQPQLRWPVPTQALKKHLTDQPVLAITRRGKYIVIHVPSEHLIIHLGMSGNLRILPQDTAIRKHDHFDCLLSSGYVLRLNDPRRFGAILWTKGPLAEFPQLKKLGPEPFSAAFSAKYLQQIASKHKVPIKALIMNAASVVGVGNIYASESLFMAKINPQRPAHSLTDKDCVRLHKAIQKILANAIQKGGTTLKDFSQSDGKPGYFKQELKVYGRKDEPCKKCHTNIIGIQLGQRSTYYCPSCQV